MRSTITLQPSLFEDYKFMNISFPKPQYLGAKYVHSDWIAKHIPESANVILDAFSGSQSVGPISTMTEFEKWDNEFRNQNLYAFNGNFYGLLWLKVHAICRSKQLRQC